MQYFISFLEGIITFVSPCLLPMLPIYISYFAGDSERDTKRVVKNALGFILGFTPVSYTHLVAASLAGLLGGAAAQWVFDTLFRPGLVERIGESLASLGSGDTYTAVQGAVSYTHLS